MNIATLLVTTVACLLIQQPVGECMAPSAEANESGYQAAAGPVKDIDALDVVLSARAAYVWDLESGATLHEKAPDERRPIASLNKLASALAVVTLTRPTDVVEIPKEVAGAQRLGAHVRLPVGQHVMVSELLEAALVASANDAVVALAVSSMDSEDNFVEYANDFLLERGFNDTRLSNATGFSGGNQYSTAREVGRLLEMAYENPELRAYLSSPTGTLTTSEGTRRNYETTNDLLGGYLPILSGKTGYTVEAGENLAVIVEGEGGQRIGAVVLGSDYRFLDMKVLVDWIWRHYSWS